MTTRAALLVLPVAISLTPATAVARLSHRERVTAWSGAWAGGRTLVTCDPVRVVHADVESFDLLDDLPSVVPDQRFADAVGGGWFGYLGFHAAESGPMDHTSLGYYRDLLSHDGETWRYEALVDQTFTAAAAAERCASLVADLSGPVESPAAALRLRSAPDRTAHVVAVERCIQAIRQGQIYQANICTQLDLDFTGSPYDAWGRLVEDLAPARAALVVDILGTAISASPELFLRRRGDDVLTAPIKGTRPRTEGDDEQAVLGASLKDRAENIMIVDLMRNDLSRVCAVGSVRVPALLSVEAHPGVWHLVSYVDGVLRPGTSNAELLRATFPPGSVTGAPKISAIDQISELEAKPRGLYTGALGFSSPLAGLELSVAIRTLEVSGGHATLGVGGGVTADSTPIEEWEECITKAAPVLRTLGLDPASVGTPAAAGLSDPRRGIFSTMLRVAGEVRELTEHCARLRRSYWEVYRRPLTAAIESAVADLPGSPDPARVRVITDASEPAAVRAEVHPCDLPVEMADQRGVRLRLAELTALEHHKYVDRDWLVEMESGQAADEAVLFHDSDGVLLEGSRSNVFLVVDGVLWTPALDGRLLPGIVRQAVLNLADDVGIPARIGLCRLEDLGRAQEVFLCNSIRRLQWVRSVGDHRWSAPGPLTTHLATRIR